MDRGRNVWNGLLVTMAFGFAMMGAPQSSSAAVKFGVDGIWVPLASSSVEQEGAPEPDSSHNVASFGASAHGGIGFEILSVGLKLNYFNDGLQLETDDSTEKVRRNQIDINAMLRLGIPATKIGVFGEGGASVSTEFDGLGYNVGLGAEYTLFSLPLTKFNLGLEGQYVKLPSVVNEIETDSKSARLLVFFGVDFGP